MINNPDFITPLVDLPGENPKPLRISNKEPFSPKPAIYKDSKLPFLTNLYVASLTVVGLFIVFRFVQKSR
jgi:hypothetical protein